MIPSAVEKVTGITLATRHIRFLAMQIALPSLEQAVSN